MMKGFSLVLSLLVLLILGNEIAHGEMRAVTVAAVVKSFSEKTVTVRVQNREITLPRSAVRQKRLSVGLAILLTLHGDQIEYLFKSVASSDSDRKPASEIPQPKR